EREKFLDRKVGHREWIVGKVDLLLLLVPLIHRKINDPAEFETVLCDQTKLFADLGARRPCEFHEVLGLAGDEERRIADTELELVGDLLGALRADVLGKRPGAAFFAFAPEDISEARLAFAL